MPADAEQIIKRFNKAKSDRGTTEQHWQDVARFVMPDRYTLYQSTPGEQKRNQIYDSTGEEDAVMLAAGLHGLLTNPFTQWLQVGATDQEVDSKRANRRWFRTVSERMLSVLNNPATNFPTSIYEVYLDMVVFGLGNMNRRLNTRQIEYEARPIQNLYLCGDSGGRVTDVYRYIEMGIQEAIEDFGEENIFPKLLDEYKRSGDKPNAKNKICLVHATYKRGAYDPTRADAANKPWASCWVDIENKHLMRESGFDKNPFFTPRWRRGTGEVYGRGPAMMALPDIRELNARKKTNLIAEELGIHPPIMVQARSTDGPIYTNPRSINYYRAGTQLPTPMQTGVRPDLGHTMMEAVKQDIHRKFFIDLLALPIIDRMTATEAMLRTQQRQTVFSPIIARLHGDLLGPLILDLFDEMQGRGMFPDPPTGLFDQQVSISFISPLAIAQKASEAQAFQQFLLTVTPLIQADPRALQNIDVRNAFKRLSASLNIHPDMMISDQQFDALREQEDMQNAMAQAQIAGEAASAAHSGAQALNELTQAGAVQ